MSVLEFKIERPTADTKIGLRLSSESPEDKPTVKAMSGVAANSGLQLGDVIMEINGQSAENSVVASAIFKKPLLKFELRAFRQNNEVTEATSQNVEVPVEAGKPLGLHVDETNCIEGIDARSRAAKSEGLRVGQRIVAVNGAPLPLGQPLVPHLPSPEMRLVLTVQTPQSHLELKRLQQRTMSTVTPRELIDAERPPLSHAQQEELRLCFELLGGNDEAGERVDATRALAAVSHFDAGATLQKVFPMCVSHSGRKDGELNSTAFLALMHDVAMEMGPAQASARHALPPRSPATTMYQWARGRLAPCTAGLPRPRPAAAALVQQRRHSHACTASPARDHVASHRCHSPRPPPTRNAVSTPHPPARVCPPGRV